MELVIATITVFAWGTWLIPSHRIAFPNEQTRIFYVALGNFLLSGLILLIRRESPFAEGVFWYPFFGGLIWSLGGLCAFSAISRVGITRAFGIWAPLNVVVGILWGMFLWREFMGLPGPTQLLATLAVSLVLAGVVLIIFSGSSSGTEVDNRRDLVLGFSLAMGAGILWGSYFIPNDYLLRTLPTTSLWQLAFPLAVGILTGCSGLVLLTGKSPLLPSKSHYARVLLSGLLWSIGNFSMLLLVERMGPGKGFTIAQLSIVVNALCGILIFKEPRLRTRAGALVLAGIFLAGAGGIFLGNLG